jgi:hypothetical protein
MMVRPILRPIPCLRAIARTTASLTGNIVPERSQALLYAGQSSIGPPRLNRSSAESYTHVQISRCGSGAAAPIPVLPESRVHDVPVRAVQVDLAASIDLHTAFGRTSGVPLVGGEVSYCPTFSKRIFNRPHPSHRLDIFAAQTRFHGTQFCFISPQPRDSCITFLFHLA